MSFFSRLRSSMASRAPRARTKDRPAPARLRPNLEALEDRWLPSQVSLTVSSLADSGPGTLRAAVLAGDAGSPSDKFTIGFGVSGTIDLQSPLPDLNNSIAVQGPGAGSLTVQRDAAFVFTSAIVTVDAAQTASLSGLTIANGDAGGILNFGTLTVSNSIASGNSANPAYGGEGGGALNFGTLTVSGSALTNNSASFGGGIYNFEGTLTVSGSTLSGNSAVHRGGGIANAFVASATISGSLLSGNSAGSDGGAIYNVNATLTVSGSTLCGNSAAENGGGIYNLALSPGTSVTVRDSTLSGNSAAEGGGIYNDASALLTIRGGTFSGNTAGNSGGAIYNAGTATIQEGTLSDNSAGYAGGGIFNAASGTLAVKDSTVLGNHALLGADLYNLGAFTLNDSTVGVIGP